MVKYFTLGPQCVIAGEARGQQERLQYSGGSSGMVEGSVAEMERFGML